MRRHFKFAAGAAAIAFSGMAFSQATPLDITPYNLQVRGGIVIPLDDVMRSASDNWFGLGVDILFQQQWIKNSTTYLSVDWIGKSLKGAHGNIFPICLNQKFATKPMGENTTYFFLGVGATVFDVVSTDTVIGGRAGVGLDLGPNIFVEGTVFFSDLTSTGMRDLSAGFYLGYRW